MSKNNMFNPPRGGGRGGGDGDGRGRGRGGGGGGGYAGSGGNRGRGTPNYSRNPTGGQPPGSIPPGVMIGEAPHQIPRSNFAPLPRPEALGVYRENDASEPDKAVQNMEQGLNRGGLLTTKLGQMALHDKNALPGRPGYCDTGRAVVVWANYFHVMFKKHDLFINNYKIVFIGKAPSQAKKGRIIQLLLPMLELEKQKIGCRTNFRDILCTDKAIPGNAKKGSKKEYTVKYSSEWQEPRPVDPDRPLPEFKVELVYDMGFQVSDLLKALDPNKGEPLPVFYETMIQAMNVIFNHGPYEAEHTVAVVAKTGLNKYFDSRRVPGESTFHQLGNGLEAQRGFIKSVRLGTGRILLNVNTVTSVFTQPVSLKYYYQESLSRIQHPMKAKKMRLLKCGRMHLIKGTRKKSNGEYMFPPATVLDFARKEDAVLKGNQGPEQKPRFVNWTWQDSQRSPGPKNVEFFFKEHIAKGKPEKAGEWISVFNYFRKTYPTIRLDDTLPVINTGSVAKPSYVPMDVLLILPGNQVKAKLDGQQTQEMVKFACRAPKLNAAAIADRGRQLLGLDAPANAALASMGIEVGNNMIKVVARVLQPPKIHYAGKKTIDVRFGSWNMSNVQFVQPGTVKPWSWVTMGPRPNVDRFLPWVQKFSRFMASLGLAMGNFVPGKKHFCEKEDQLEQVFGHYSGLGVKFLLFILEDDGTGIYRRIKMLGDIQFGIHTVCVQGKPGKFIPKGRFQNDPPPEDNPQYFANIGLKFNLKGGGINNTLAPGALKFIEEGKKTMVVGLDVTHPSPGSAPSAKSVAAMVASINWQLGQWPGTISVQRDQPPGSAREMVDELQPMLASRLVLWQRNNRGQLPENILIYRDGISEGQYDLCLKEELPRLQAACKDAKAFPAYSRPGAFPRFTIVVCSKRHHTRFFPTKTNEASNTSNCQPGTVVDRDVTTPHMWESFLQAHHCIQGTAKPCRYIVIKDEIFSNKAVVNPRVNAATMLAELTNNMCHMFSRATKAVSLCPPAYYADILCERARVYLADHYTENASSNAGSTSQATGPAPYVDRESGRRITQLKGFKEENWATLNTTQKAAFLTQENSDREAQQRAVTIHEKLADTMFYV